MERIDRLDLDQAAPGIYAIRSSSDTAYILDHDPSRGSRLMRATSPGTDSASQRDDTWVPLATVESIAGTGVVVVGSRAKWLADPGGTHHPQAHWSLSWVVTGIERWDSGELEAFLAARADQRRDRLAEVLDEELPRWVSVLEHLGREDAPSTPNAENVERLRGRDRSDAPSQQDILDALEEERRHNSDDPPQWPGAEAP